MQLNENAKFANRYQLERLLGRGGFSEVWLATDAITKLQIAIKVYAPGQGMDSDGLNEFSQELASVFNLNHTNLLKPTHVDSWEGMPYLILPYCAKGSLNKRADKISEQEFWTVLHDVAAGLQYLHKNGIVHQDIKPDNILLDNAGNYVITDFGISTKARSTLRKSVIGGALSGGTMAYMGPERFSKQPAPTKASDIWSLGAMMFELLTGNVPFGEMGGGMQKGGAEIPEITEDVSAACKGVIEQMLSLNTWDRPTADKLVEITTPHIGKQPISNADTSGCNDIGQNHSTSTQRFIYKDKPSSSPAPNTIQISVKGSKREWLKPMILIILLLAIIIIGFVIDTYGYISDTPCKKEDTKQEIIRDPITNYNQEPSPSTTITPQSSSPSLPSSADVAHIAVDLGLSVKWASCNIGASSPEQYGDYFAWGETSPKTTYTWANYQWKVLEQSEWSWKQNDIVYYTPETQGKEYVKANIIGTNADAASVNWGDEWRMPNSNEMKELLNKCKWEVASLNNVYGVKITGKTGNWIFLPASGYIDGSKPKQICKYGYYSMGFLWGSTSKDKPCSIWFDTSGARLYGDYDFYLGQTIRPVHP